MQIKRSTQLLCEKREQRENMRESCCIFWFRCNIELYFNVNLYIFNTGIYTVSHISRWTLRSCLKLSGIYGNELSIWAEANIKGNSNVISFYGFFIFPPYSVILWLLLFFSLAEPMGLYFKEKDKSLLIFFPFNFNEY